jgi:hypothetical protein
MLSPCRERRELLNDAGVPVRQDVLNRVLELVGLFDHGHEALLQLRVAAELVELRRQLLTFGDRLDSA